MKVGWKLYCCNLSVGVALNVRFTTNGMCANNTRIYMARTSNNRVIASGDLCCCLLPQCEALRTCRSGKLWLSDRNNIKYGFFLPISEVKNRVMNRLHNACFAILNIATSFWVLQNCGVIYKTNTTFIRTSSRKFSSNSTNICANSKITFVHQSQMTLLVKSLCFQIALVLMKDFAKL